jgi:hypothetical protein
VVLALYLFEIEESFNQIINLLRDDGLSSTSGTMLGAKGLSQRVTCGYVLCSLEDAPDVNDVYFSDSESYFNTELEFLGTDIIAQRILQI